MPADKSWLLGHLGAAYVRCSLSSAGEAAYPYINVATIGNYEVLTALKSGGMGDILLGRRKGLGNFEQLVAIKTIRAELAGTDVVRAHFLDEAAILARVNHGGVAGVHDFGEQNGVLYMVMEYVAGISFRELMEMAPPPMVAARAIAEACRGLHAAHELKDLAGNLMGVVHRDISPDNLILGFDGHVKVIDFGIALIRNRQAPATEFGALKGKPAYMSPEQVKSETMDRRSDIFSLAVVLWEMVTRRDMFEGDSIYAIARAVEHQVISPPSQFAGPLPVGLDAAVLNALTRNVDQRTPTAAHFAEQLEEAVVSGGGETLAKWAAQHLEAHRDKHRRWLAEIIALADGTAPMVPRGRAVGQVTAIGADASRAALTAAGTAQTEFATNVGDAQAELVVDGGAAAPALAASRTGRFAAVAAVLVVGVGVGSWALLRSTRPELAPSANRERDSGLTAEAPRGVAPALVAVDAAPTPPTVAGVDAALDAPVLTSVHRPPSSGVVSTGKASRRNAREDATVGPGAPTSGTPTPPTVEARPAAPVPSGTGKLTVTADPFVNVAVDGATWGATPIFNRALPAGSHTVVLTDPETGAVRLQKNVDVGDGQVLRLSAPGR